MATVLIPAPLVFAFYYRSVISREEAFLTLEHGDAYRQYLQTMPRWIQDFSRWRGVAAGRLGSRLR